MNRNQVLVQTRDADSVQQRPYTVQEAMALHAQARASAQRLRQEAIDAFWTAFLAQARHPVASARHLAEWVIALLSPHRRAKVIE